MRTLLIFFFLFYSEAIWCKVNQKEWTGTASFYAVKFQGRKTASGERFSNQKMTGANNFLPFGTYVRVTNLRNEKSVVVKINDRLHGRNKRLIDLSRLAAEKLGFIKQGTCKVKMEITTPESAVTDNDEGGR